MVLSASATTGSGVAVAGRSTTSARERFGRRLLFAGAFSYFVLPMVAVVLYSFATRWQANILPDGYTLDWWRKAVTDPSVISAFTTTLLVATGVALLDIAVVVPAAYWARVRNRRIKTVIELSAAIPFALPYIVIAFGLLQFAGIVAPGLQGTLPLLVLGHAAVAFPFLYWAVDGAMAAAGVERLSEAAEACGASPIQILLRVILPNIRPGIVTGGLLAFATSFGEFAMTQTIARGIYTVPIWSAEAIRSYSGEPGAFNRLAVVTTIGFFVLFLLSAAVVYANRGRTVRLLPGAADIEQKEAP